MSLHQQARELIDQAQTAIQAGNPEYAIELLRQSILYSGKDAEAYILLGIALAHTKMPADAENAFKKATQLDPNSVKARYNLAVHQYTEGQVRAALNNARKASELDALHAGSRDLAARIEKELGIDEGAEPPTTAAGNPAPTDEYRDGYEPQPVQTMPFIERMGVYWSLVGWTIAVVSLALGAVFLSMVLPHMSQNRGNADALVQMLSRDPKMNMIQITYFLVNLSGLAFIAVDTINRRANLLWILPQAVCGCTGFTFVILPIYMRFGRNN
jgi:tetratricopeptide (TPR) repeat protein